MTNLEHLVIKVPLYSAPLIVLAVSKPYEFISGGIKQFDRGISPAIYLTRRMRTQRVPNITWLTGLKSLKIKQIRRYECSEVKDGSLRRVGSLSDLGRNILSNMPNLVHFSSDLHCFSENCIVELKMKILDFEPGRPIDQAPLLFL